MQSPKAPQHLTAEAQKFWKQINEEFELGTEALTTLRAALENWDLAQAAREAVNRDGLVMAGKRHPAIDIQKQAYGIYLRAMRQLGLDVVGPGPIGRPSGR